MFFFSGKMFLEKLLNQLNDLDTVFDNVLLLGYSNMTPEDLKFLEFWYSWRRQFNQRTYLL